MNYVCPKYDTLCTESLWLLLRSQWYRKLCVMVWILEAMQLDSAHHAVPLAKCWNLDCKYTDEIGRKRTHERNQRIYKQWQELNLKVKVSEGL